MQPTFQHFASPCKIDMQSSMTFLAHFLDFLLGFYCCFYIWHLNTGLVQIESKWIPVYFRTFIFFAHWSFQHASNPNLLKRLSMIGNILEKEIPLPFTLHLATNVFTCCWPQRLLECNYMRLMIIGWGRAIVATALSLERASVTGKKFRRKKKERRLFRRTYGTQG